jgi:AraC-like DNA-binding protein
LQNLSVTYRESATATPGALLWQNSAAATPGPSLILPDGCMDLIWDGQRLFVAGPDTTARLFQGSPNDRYVGLRFSGGLGPALLGVPADELTDRSLLLTELWPAAPARRLTEQLAADPARAWTGWLAENRYIATDSLGPRVAAMVAGGLSVAAVADRVGLSARQLHRRCLPLFGYGPRHLARVLRLQRAVVTAKPGRSLARLAVESGYYDQAHLSREVRALAATTPTRLFSPSQ